MPDRPSWVKPKESSDADERSQRSSAPDGFTRRGENRPNRPTGFTQRGSDQPERPAAPARPGFTRRGGSDDRPSPAPAPRKPRAPRSTPASPRSSSTDRDSSSSSPPAVIRKRPPLKLKPGDKPRPTNNDSWCLGVVKVSMSTDLAIMVEGGDTTGRNWIPRSKIQELDIPTKLPQLNRHADIGDEGEVWLPSWLANKIPW